MRLTTSRKGAAGLDKRMRFPEIEWRRSPLSRVSTIRQRCVAAQKKWPDSKTIPASTRPSSRIWSFADDGKLDEQTDADLESIFGKEEDEGAAETLVSESDSVSPLSEKHPEDDEIEDWLSESEDDEEKEDDEDEVDDEDEEDEENEDLTGVDDIAKKDKQAYERLIIEGADIENAKAKLAKMDRKIRAMEESYLDGSAYESEFESPLMPIKRLEDFPYKPMPQFSMQFLDLLNRAKLDEEAQMVKKRVYLPELCCLDRGLVQDGRM